MQFRTWLHLANLCAINSYKRYFCPLSLLQRWHKDTLNAFRGRNCIIYYSICFGRLKFGFAINVSSQVPDQAVCLCVCRWCWRSLSTTRRRARVVRWFRVFCLAWWLKTVWRSRTASPSPSTPKMMSNSMKVRCTAISRAPFSGRLIIDDCARHSGKRRERDYLDFRARVLWKGELFFSCIFFLLCNHDPFWLIEFALKYLLCVGRLYFMSPHIRNKLRAVFLN